MSVLTLPSDRLSHATKYAHSSFSLERFVEERLLALDGVFIPVRIGGIVHNSTHCSPLILPPNVVAVLIKQPQIPATFTVEESPAGYVVKEREPIKPAEYYLLFNSARGGRRCTIEAFVELRYFYYAVEMIDGNPVTV